MVIGARDSADTSFDYTGDIDDVQVYNKSLNINEIRDIFNYGSIQPPAPELINFSVTAKNIDGTALNNFTLNINGTDYTTTTGTATTNIIQGTGIFDLTIKNARDNNGAYFNKTYSTIDTASNYEATGLYQAEVKVNASNIYGAQVFGQLKIDGHNANTTNYITAGATNFSFFNETYFNHSSVQNVLALDNKTFEIPDNYQSLLNVSVRNIFTNQSITNWTGNLTNNAGYNLNIFPSQQIPLMRGNYSVYVDSQNYSIDTSTNYKNVTLTSFFHTEYFYLYTNNTILIYCRDESTNNLITETINIVLSGSTGDTNYSTSNGTLVLENVLDGNYSVRFSGENYTLREYSISVASRSVQTLTATLSSSSDNVIFTITDSGTGEYIEGASISQYRLINSTWTLIESMNADITGRAQFSYLPDIRYRFIVSATGYNTKQFDLNPVLFTSYTIQLDSVSTTPTGQQQTASVEYTPKMFFDDETANFSIYFRSSEGTFESYGYIMTSKTGVVSQDAGLQAIGEGFNFLVNVTGANYGDTINLTYYYDTIFTENQSFSVVLPIYNGTNKGTFIHNIKNDYGLGIFERVIIALLIISVVAGLLTLIAGSNAGIGFGLLLVGYFAYIDFIPLIASIIVILIGFVFLIRREN